MCFSSIQSLFIWVITKPVYAKCDLWRCRSAWASVIRSVPLLFLAYIVYWAKKETLHTFFLNFKHRNNIFEHCYVLQSLGRHQTTTCTNLFLVLIIYRRKHHKLWKNTQWACTSAKVFTLSYLDNNLIRNYGWLGRAMVLGSFQCQGVLLLRHMVGQGPAVLAAGAGWMGSFLFFSYRLSYLPFLMPHLLGDGWTYWNIVVSAVITQQVVSYYWRCARWVLVNRLVGLSLPRNSMC